MTGGSSRSRHCDVLTPFAVKNNGTAPVVEVSTASVGSTITATNPQPTVDKPGDSAPVVDDSEADEAVNQLKTATPAASKPRVHVGIHI